MKKIESHETALIGQWIYDESHVEGDAICKRVQYLYDQYLKYIATDDSGWEILYQDPEDGRYWELTYPQGHMHGGGPPALKFMEIEEAEQKYGAGVSPII